MLDWRWPTHADRVALLQGYCEEMPVTDEFMAAWKATLVLSDMVPWRHGQKRGSRHWRDCTTCT